MTNCGGGVYEPDHGSPCPCSECRNLELTPAQKWRALSNPQSVADYAVTMTLDEIMQVPEAIEEVSKYVPLGSLKEAGI